MDQGAEAAVLGGPGTLTRVPAGIVVAGPDVPIGGLLQVVTATADAPAAARRAALEDAVGDADRLAVAVTSADGLVVVLGHGLQLRSDHVGHRLVQHGPCATVLTGCAALAVVPPTAPWWPPGDAPRLGTGVRSGAGFWATLMPAAGSNGAVVDGVLCTCGAFGHPMTLRCPACGTVVATPRPTSRQPQVPVARLVLDDARSLVIDGPVVIGREPHHATEVQDQVAFPLVLTDPQRSVSRVHAVLHVDGWDLLLEDRHSANGVSLRPEDAGIWLSMDPGSRVRILPGTDIALGRRTLRVIGGSS